MAATTALPDSPADPSAPDPVIAAVAPVDAVAEFGLDDWVGSGRLLLASATSAERLDALLVSTTLPEADAVGVLSSVRATQPGALRLLVTPNDDVRLSVEAMALAHRVVHRRRLPECLTELVPAALRLQEVLTLERDDNHERSALDSLPSLPGPYYDFVVAVRSENVELAALAEIIERDTVLAGRVLSLANSAFCGLSVEVVRLEHAVSVLGLDMLEALVSATAAFHALRSRHTVAVADSVWSHSRVTADLAECLVRRLTSDKRELASCVQSALLHDIGRLAIAELLPESAAIIDSLLSDRSRKRQQAEQAVIGAGHDQLGGWLLSLWGLPAVTVATARCHNDIAAAAEVESPVPLAVAVANALLTPEIASDPDELEQRARSAGLYDRFELDLVRGWLDATRAFFAQ